MGVVAFGLPPPFLRTRAGVAFPHNPVAGAAVFLALLNDWKLLGYHY